MNIIRRSVNINIIRSVNISMTITHKYSKIDRASGYKTVDQAQIRLVDRY